MPERRVGGYACEDEARASLLAARGAFATDGARLVDASGGGSGVALGASACLSLRWRRSGGTGFLFAADGTGSARDPGRDSASGLPIAWVPLQAGDDAVPAAPEWRLHQAVYLQRPDVEAIVRCRPPFATTLACSEMASSGIPGFHPDVESAAGGSIASADCGLPGTILRPDPLLAAIRDRQACLLAGWGLLTCGSSLAAATLRAAELEALARIWWQLLQLEPHRQAPAALR